MIKASLLNLLTFSATILLVNFNGQLNVVYGIQGWNAGYGVGVLLLCDDI